MTMRPNADATKLQLDVEEKGKRTSFAGAVVFALFNAIPWLLIGSLYFGAGSSVLFVVGTLIFAVSLFGVCLLGGSLGPNQ